MRASVFRGPGRMDVEQVPDPEPGPTDVVLEVAACGVCGSDLHTAAAGAEVPGGRILGHEFAGTVVAVGGEADGLDVGDRVAGVPIQPCGRCRRCRNGLRNICETWTSHSLAFGLPGAFAERIRIPAAVEGVNLHRLPVGLPIAHGALIEPLAVATHAVRRAGPVAGRPAVVLGLGPVGLLAAQVLAAHGMAPVVGVDLSPARRAAAGQVGLVALPGGPEAELAAAVADVVGPREVDVVLEASGAPTLVPTACALVRPGGTVVLVALYHAPATIDPMAAVQREITVRGSANVVPTDFRDAVAMVADGRVALGPMVSHRVALDDIDAAFTTASDAATSVKVLVVP